MKDLIENNGFKKVHYDTSDDNVYYTKAIQNIRFIIELDMKNETMEIRGVKSIGLETIGCNVCVSFFELKKCEVDLIDETINKMIESINEYEMKEYKK